MIFIHEDNTTCIIAYTTGKNPTMKDLERCFGVSLAWGHQRMMSGDYIMVHTRSHDMSADIYTIRPYSAGTNSSQTCTHQRNLTRDG